MIEMKWTGKPITISQTVWFYRNRRSIDLVYEIRENGRYIRTDIIHLKLRKILGEKA